MPFGPNHPDDGACVGDSDLVEVACQIDLRRLLDQVNGQDLDAGNVREHETRHRFPGAQCDRVTVEEGGPLRLDLGPAGIGVVIAHVYDGQLTRCVRLRRTAGVAEIPVAEAQGVFIVGATGIVHLEYAALIGPPVAAARISIAEQPEQFRVIDWPSAATTFDWLAWARMKFAKFQVIVVLPNAFEEKLSLWLSIWPAVLLPCDVIPI